MWKITTYRDGWFPEGNKCILTNAEEATGMWKGFKYAVFLSESPHVAFHPSGYIVIDEQPLSKEEAERILMKTLNAQTVYPDFVKEYGVKQGGRL